MMEDDVRAKEKQDCKKRHYRSTDFGGVAERRGSGLQIPLHGFKSRLHLQKILDLWIVMGCEQRW
jgi:hypothetical protein